MPPKRHSTESGEETKTKKARSSEPKKKWSKEDKTEILLEVIATAQPDWDQLAERFGVTKSKASSAPNDFGSTALTTDFQVKDQWRCVHGPLRTRCHVLPPDVCKSFVSQHILPHLKKTGSVSGDAHDVKSD